MVDRKRLELVGPDVNCAEWLLRCGAAVRFKGQNSMISDYNELIALEDAGKTVNYRVEELYAENAGLYQNGFDNLIGCHHVKKISLINCRLIDFPCLDKLKYVKDSLEHLEIKSCQLVTDEGLLLLRDLSNLKILILQDLPAVKNRAEVVTALKNSLAKCEITYNY